MSPAKINDENPTPPSAPLMELLSEDLREAKNSFSMLQTLFHDESRREQFGQFHLNWVTMNLLQTSLFSTLITAVGRLMDSDDRSASVCAAAKRLQEYRPTDRHVDDLWKYNLKNWKYNFDTSEVELLHPNESDKDGVVEEFLKKIPTIIEKFDQLSKAYEPIKLWRNKRIAHRDSDYSNGLHELPGIDIQMMSGFLDILTEVVSELCSTLYMTGIDTSDAWGVEAGENLLSVGHADVTTRKIALYIARASENKSADYETCVGEYAARWSSPKGAELVEKSLEFEV